MYAVMTERNTMPGWAKLLSGLILFTLVILSLPRERITSFDEVAAPSPTVVANVSSTTEVYPVIRVVDGDTVKVQRNGVEETVRLIGVNTPESVDPRRPVECFGKEASAYTTKRLTGQSVQIETDPSQGERDKYHRLLGYVILSDGTNFNEQLIRDGYAVEYTYDTPYRYQENFRAAQKEAEQGKRGLWGDAACEQSSFTCAGKKTCGEMVSCSEATFYLQSCGLDKLDGNGDGLPCESLCR